jgi:hypothetical protein
LGLNHPVFRLPIFRTSSSAGVQAASAAKLRAVRCVSHRVKSTMSEIHELRPARPDEHDPAERGYMPRLPWKWIVSLGLFLALAFFVMHSHEQDEIEALKTSILTAYKSELSPLVERHDALVGKVMALTLAAAKDDAPESKVDPRLNIDALHKGQGLYLRLEAKDATSEKAIASASLDMPPDAIARCLGLAPASAAELFARGTFLEKSWIKQAEHPDSLMKLRVVAEEIRQRTKRDLPFVAEALKSQWFMLVLERGENRRDAPVDVYLWDLKTGKELLSSRVQAEGALVAARIVVNGVKPGNYATGAQTGAAQDCSIASQLRSLAGQPAATFEAAPPAPREAMQEAAEEASKGEPKVADEPGAAEPAKKAQKAAKAR